jgi:ABC-type branched-subunit amino acid transport system substrate-binding protein
LILALASLSVAGTVFVPACEATGTPPAAVPSDAGCRTPGITDDHIKLGLLYPDTGNTASLFLPFRAGVDARLGVANAAGGVRGRKVDYIWRDDESLPQVNLAAARTLVESEEVFGIIESTSVASGSAEFLHERGVPVTGASLETPWTVYDNMFSYSNLISDGPSITTWGEFAAGRGGHSAVIVEAPFSDTSLRFSRQLRKSLESAGIEVVETLDGTGPIDMTKIGKKIKESGADVLVGAVTATTFAQVVAGARLAHADLRVVLSPTGYDEGLLRYFGEIFAGAYFFVDFLPFELNTAAHQQFLAAMAEYSPQMQPPNHQTALSGWLSADMFLRGLQDAGPCPTRGNFITRLRSVRDYDARGLLPDPIDFEAEFGHINRCYTFLQVSSDGKRFEVVKPVPRCGSALG